MAEMITRQQITMGETIHAYTEPTACIGSHPNPRIFVDSLTIAGESLKKNLAAVEGGENVTKSAETATAAAAVIEVSITPGQINPTCSFVFGALMDAASRTTMEEKVAAALKAGDVDMKIKIGTCNKKQEFKTDQQWGIIIDLSDLELYPISPSAFRLDIKQTELMGVAQHGMNFHVITLEGVTTSKGQLPVCSAASTDKGLATIGYIATGG